MTLTSQVIVSNNFEQTLDALEALRSREDILIIRENEKAFSVEDAKKVIAKAYMTSETLSVIILVAKVFSPIVQNKLLKLIEEPPRNKAFILITESKSTILPTIHSRLPIQLEHYAEEVFDLGLDVARLSLALVYDFMQKHKRTSSQDMSMVIESIAKEAIYSDTFNLDKKTLKLFSDCILALDMGSPPQFILNTILLKLLGQKRR
ncbi:DNA poymerase III subunit delta' [hydrothermal vent metagenome]|uniref:DNA poymerase III subunit delta n=1 Tax=hydrothermal vent metagenome TaxID=652676 RepID=A0A1W1C442_9ZZZZ